MDGDREGGSRIQEINAAIHRESRPLAVDQPHDCPWCNADQCYGEKCVKCLNRERAAELHGLRFED